jgi:hypothetical protein
VFLRVEATPAQKPSALIHNIHVVQQYARVDPVWSLLYNRSMSDSFSFGHTYVTIDSSERNPVKEALGRGRQ